MKAKKFPVYSLLLLLIVCTISIVGCTTYLESRQLKELKKLKETPKGVVYSLPMLQWEFDITWRMVSCSPAEVQITIDVKEDFVPDPTKIFVLDYTKLAGFTNTSEIELGFFETGALKNVNLTADDRSAEIIGNTFKLVANVALAAAGIPSGITTPSHRAERSTGAESDVERKEVACNQETADALSALKANEPKLRELTQLVKGASEKVKDLNEIVAGAKKPSERTLRTLQAAIKGTKKNQDELEKHNKLEIAPFLARLQYKEKVRWPMSGDSNKTEAVLLPGPELKKLWFYNDTLKRIVNEEIVDALLTIHLKVNPLAGDMSNEMTDKTNRGIFYRYPMPIELTIYTDPPEEWQSRKILKTLRTKSPQHGPTVCMPFENSAFQNNRLDIFFFNSGLPEKLNFKNMRSAAEAASAAFAGIAEQLPALRQQLLNADLEKLKRETAIFEQKKALQDAKASLEPAPTADIEAETALANSKIDLINAKITLKEAEQRLAEMD